MTPDELACDQRRRLEVAMVEAVARHGYAGTTLSELARLASVSKTTFYQHFDSKEHCFWSTYEAIDRATGEQVLAAYRTGEGQRGRLRAALVAYAERVAAAPQAASLVVIDSLSLGSVAARYRQASMVRFEETLRKCYADEPERGEAPELAVRGAVGGYRQVVYRCLRRGRPEQLRECAEELADWMLGYQRPGRGHLLHPSFFANQATARSGPGSDTQLTSSLPGWDEPPDSRRSRRALTQRQRIVRAVGRLACEHGYANLSIPAISAAGGVSNQTFYQEFANKQEAFFAAFDELAEMALTAAAEAFGAEEEWRAAFAAALAALLAFVSDEPYFAQLAFLELSAAGLPGLDRADLMMDRLLAFLMPPEPNRLPGTVMEAIGGGIWTVIETELSHKRGAQLRELVPGLTDFALTPFAAE